MKHLQTIAGTLRMRCTTLLWLSIAVCTAAHGQESSTFVRDGLGTVFTKGDPRTTVGLYGSGGVAIHAASFRGLPEAPSCCLGYGSTVGSILEFGAVVQHHTTNGLVIATQVGFATMSGTFAAQESTTVIVAGKPTEARIGHDLSVTMQYLQVRPSVQYRLLDPLYGALGLGFHVNMDGSLTQSETLMLPTTSGTFQATGQRVRNGYDGPMYSANDVLVSLHVGAGASFWLDDDRRFAIEPMFHYDYYLGTPINRVDEWSLHSLRLGVALRHTMDWHIGR